MPLYICDSCNSIENTSYGNYIMNQIKNPEAKNECSECFTGKWHDKFEKIIATKEVIKKIGINNFVYYGKFKKGLESLQKL